MGQLVVRNLEDSVKEGLRRRAKKHGRSMEEEVREILRTAAHEDHGPEEGLGTFMARMVAEYGGLPSPIPELRGHKVKPVKFR